MPHVVTESCFKCERVSCVVVCPVDCFHEGANFVVIDPDVCIDCAVCVLECPVAAICEEKDLPAGQRQFVALNAKWAKSWPLLPVPQPSRPMRNSGPA